MAGGRVICKGGVAPLVDRPHCVRCSRISSFERKEIRKGHGLAPSGSAANFRRVEDARSSGAIGLQRQEPPVFRKIVRHSTACFLRYRDTDDSRADLPLTPRPLSRFDKLTAGSGGERAICIKA